MAALVFLHFRCDFSPVVCKEIHNQSDRNDRTRSKVVHLKKRCIGLVVLSQFSGVFLFMHIDVACSVTCEYIYNFCL